MSSIDNHDSNYSFVESHIVLFEIYYEKVSFIIRCYCSCVIGIMHNLSHRKS